MNVLEVRDLDFTFEGSFWLRDISFQLSAGQVLCILGPNGSGKTTLFQVLAGAAFPVRGEVNLHGRNLHRHFHSCSALMAPLPFRPSMFTLKTPYLYWQAYGHRYGMKFREIAKRIVELAPQMDMGGNLHKPIHLLSLGMQQKIGLIAAFLPDVTLRIMDEPFTGGIDPLAMETLSNWILEAKTRGETIVFTSQLTEHAHRLADRVLILREGRIAAFGPPAELVSRVGLSERDERPIAQAYIAMTEEAESYE